MTKLHAIAGGLGLALLGCADKGLSTASTGSGSATTGSVSTGTSPQPTGSDTSTGTPGGSTGSITGEADTGATTSPFISHPDLGPTPPSCDLYEPDCPRGEKCTVWSNGGSLDATRCVAVTGDQKPGEACTAENGGYDGIDDCAKGAMCWEVDPMNVGICRAFCMGAPDAPTCEGDHFCAMGRVLALCLNPCDPLLQDCPGEQLCVANGGSTFYCVHDTSNDMGQVNAPCEFADTCDKGLLCLNTPSASAACDQGTSGCCQPFCEFIEGQTGDCPNQDQECLQYYDPMWPIPPGSEDIGVCAIPP